ncbi:MAG: pyrimidine 5'-nucleotidase [Anaerolineales bacterium]|nr:pyrimidine 5'-nucleotidase [Anaerolineales bacterium]
MTLFLDLDGTVYDKHNGMWEEMSARIDNYFREVLGLPEEQILPTRDRYYAQYGSTLRGIQLNYEIDPEDYLAYVHGIDLNKYLSPKPCMREMLTSLPYPKWIFTNSDRNHASRVLKILGIEDLFAGILDVWEMSHIPKPDPRTYRHAIKAAGNPDPSTCVFVDDTLKNLAPAKAMGWHTVWVDSFTLDPSAEYSIPALKYLPEVISDIEAESWVFPLEIHQPQFEDCNY